MKKIAIFVEGQTEQIFVAQLVKHLSANRNISVSILKIQGKQGERRVTKIKAYSTDLAVEYYFFIYDCSGDIQVKGDIVDNLTSLQEENFSFVIGLRDLYPETNIRKLRHFLQFDLPKDSIPTHIILAVQEVEAWFIAEENHYSKMSQRLTLEIVNSVTGIDIQNETTEKLHHPSTILQTIYNTVAIGYQKKENQIRRTVNALDCDNLCQNVKKRNNSLNELLTCFDTIFEDTSNA